MLLAQVPPRQPEGATRFLCMSQVLAKHPRFLNRFYKEESQFTLTWRNHGMPDRRETVSTTQVGVLLQLLFCSLHNQLVCNPRSTVL